MPNRFQSATRCILFCDLTGSTQRDAEARANGTEAEWLTLKAEFLDIWRTAFSEHSAAACKGLGDGLMTHFADPLLGLQAVTQARKTAKEIAPFADLNMRAALHLGGVHLSSDGDIHGIEVDFAARLCELARPDRTLFSSTMAAAVEGYLVQGCSLHPVTPCRVSGIAGLVRAQRLTIEGIPERHAKSLGTSKRKSASLTPRNSFIGRAELVEEVTQLIVGRQVSEIAITGFGGIGKTRLARQVAQAIRDQHRWPVVFAELAPLANVDDVPAVILQALQPDVDEGMSAYDALNAASTESPLLLVLDNLEHLDHVPGLISEILTQCAHVQILTTSRAKSGGWQHVEFCIPPLTIPPVEDSPEAMMQTESARLFVDRARAVDREFALGSANAEYVGRILRQLAGIPLAIELVARRVALWDLEDIAAELESSALDVGVDAEDLPGRHHSLRASMDFSYSLLSPPAKTLLDQLLVFSGSFTLDAVREICGRANTETAARLTELVDHAWVQRTNVDGSRRMALLVPVQQYVAEIGGEVSDDLRLAHARYYTEQATRIEAGLYGPKPHEAHNQLKRGMDNFRAAFRWAANAHEHELVARMGASMVDAMHHYGFWDEMKAWIGLARRSADLLGDPTKLSQIATMQGHVAMWDNNLEQGNEHHLDALHFAILANDRRAELRAHTNLCNAYMRMSQFDECLKHADYVEQLAELTQMYYMRGEAWVYRAWAENAVGNSEKAAQYFETSTAVASELGNQRTLAYVLREKGLWAETNGDLQTATTCYDTSYRIRQELGLETLATDIVALKARVEAKRGNELDAVKLLERIAGRYHSSIAKAVTKEAKQIIGKEFSSQ